MVKEIGPIAKLMADFCTEMQEVPDGVCQNIEKVSIYLSKCINLII